MTTIEQAWRSSWAKPPAPAVETAAVAADCSCGEQVVGECEVCGQAVCPDHQESFSCDSEGTIHSECHEHSGCRSEYCWYTD